jgi:hypothetical protein
VVFPAGSALTIEPGATIRFGAGCSLVSYSPLIAQGTAAAPIVFTAYNPWFKWGVVAAVDAGHAVFEHALVAHARQAVVNGVDLPGGVSLVNTNVDVRFCRFTEMFGKDALYVRRGNVLIRDNCVQNASKDGLDLDGGSGLVCNNRFVDCGDEGIDLSEDENIEARDNTVLDADGGRVAADHGLDRLRAANTLGYSGGESQ